MRSLWRGKWTEFLHQFSSTLGRLLRLFIAGYGNVDKLVPENCSQLREDQLSWLQILGQTQSHIHLAGTDFTYNVLVSGNVTQDCLLGADVLAAHGFVIDLQSRVLRQGQASTPLLHQPESTLPVCRVAVSDTVIVRAGEEKLLFANVDNSSCSHLAGTSGVLEPKEGFEERHQLLLARVVATPDNGVVPLRVANLTSSAVTLYRGTNIAKFCPLPELNSEGTCQSAEYCEVQLSSSTL